MEDALETMIVLGILFVAFPAIILNYMTQWRKAKGITIEDENLLDDLHDTARRLDARLESIERIIAADNPGWKDSTLGSAPADRRLTDRFTDAAEPRLATRR